MRNVIITCWIVCVCIFTSLTGLLIYRVSQAGLSNVKIIIDRGNIYDQFDAGLAWFLFGIMSISFMAGYYAKPKKERPEWDFEKALNNKK